MNTVYKTKYRCRHTVMLLWSYDPKIIGSQLNFTSIVEFQIKGQKPCAYLCRRGKEWLVWRGNIEEIKLITESKVRKLKTKMQFKRYNKYLLQNKTERDTVKHVILNIKELKYSIKDRCTGLLIKMT